MVFRVGLTGGIASGKTTVSGLFEQHGIDIIDADLIARELSQPGTIEYMAIVKQFGETCLLSDGQLNRPLLRQLIFSDPQARQALEGILHPSIRQQLLARARSAQSPYCILSVPLLIEANMQDCVHRILVVDVKENIQLSRLQKRDNLSRPAAIQHLSTQLNREQRLQYANDIIDNSDGITKLKLQVAQLHALYCQLAKADQDPLQSPG